METRMRHALTALALVACSTAAVAQAPEVLATVDITRQVLANGEPLAPGAYELRLTGERPPALVGQSPDAQEWVDIVADGQVVAREVAEILRDGSRAVATGVRVDLLRGGEFLRVSVQRENGPRYLIHFPIPGAEQQ